MLGMFQALLAPRYPRRYVGRHRAYSTIRVASAVAIQLSMTSMGMTAITSSSEQTAN
jgi:hypothetical protein